MGYLILLDVPLGEATIDFMCYDTEIDTWFKGFLNISEGVHYVSVKTPAGYRTGFWFHIKEFDKTIIIKKYNKETNLFEEADKADVTLYTQKVLDEEMYDSLIEYDIDDAELFWKLSGCLSRYGKLPELKMDNSVSTIPDQPMSPFLYTFTNLYRKDTTFILAEFQYAFLRFIACLEVKDPDTDGVRRWINMINILYTATVDDMEKEPELINPWVDYYLDQIIYLQENVYNDGEDENLYRQIFGNNVVPFVNNMVGHKRSSIKSEGKIFAGILAEYEFITKVVSNDNKKENENNSNSKQETVMTSGFKEYTDKKDVESILNNGLRIKSILENKLNMKPATVSRIIIDRDNVKIDVYDGDDNLYRFKSKGEGNALMPDPSVGGVKMVYDPALDFAVNDLCKKY